MYWNLKITLAQCVLNALDLAIRCYCTTLPMIRESKPPTSINVDDNLVNHESDHDGSCINKRAVHKDHCSVVATNETSKPKTPSFPILKLAIL